MKETVITSSVLILVLLLLRFCFRNFISQRVQYALWLLVVLRLLIPVELPGFSLSVLNFGQQTQKAVSNTLEQNVYLLPIGETPASELPHAQSTAPGEPVETGDSFGYPILSQDGQTVTRYATHATLSQVLGWVWKGGMVLTALFFLSVNLMFWKKLQQFHIRVQSDILIKERGENSDGSNENTRNYPCRFTRWNESIRNKQSHADR